MINMLRLLMEKVCNMEEQMTMQSVSKKNKHKCLELKKNTNKNASYNLINRFKRLREKISGLKDWVIGNP